MRFARSLPPSQCRESRRIERRPSPRRWTPATPLRSAPERHPGAADAEACSLGPGAVLHAAEPAPDASGNPLDRPVVRAVPGGAGGKSHPLTHGGSGDFRECALYVSFALWVLATNPGRAFYAALGGQPVYEKDVKRGRATARSCLWLARSPRLRTETPRSVP